MVLVPRNQMEKAVKELGPYISTQNKSLVRLMYTPSDYTVWAQDYFEFAVDGKSKTPSVIDLPYFDASGEHIPTTLATACNYNLIGQAPIDLEKVKDASGNFGGNIEALTDELLLVGNNISPLQKSILQKRLTQKIIEINVDWLKVGHVDELVSIIPIKNKPGKCPFDIMYSSPGKALEILKTESTLQKAPLNLRIGFGDTKKIFDLWSCFRDEDKSPGCNTIQTINKTYEKIVQSNIEYLKKELISYDTSCSKVNFVPIPMLFTSSKEQKNYGASGDEAITLEPNPVNNVILGDHILLPKQNLEAFHNYTENILSKYDKQLTFVDGKYVHYFDGGIHCSMNFQRACRPNE